MLIRGLAPGRRSVQRWLPMGGSGATAVTARRPGDQCELDQLELNWIELEAAAIRDSAIARRLHLASTRSSGVVIATLIPDGHPNVSESVKNLQAYLRYTR